MVSLRSPASRYASTCTLVLSAHPCACLTVHVVKHILETGATVVHGDFEWDATKAAANFAKHGVSFEEATTAIMDPRALFLADESGRERRLSAVGMSQRARILFVVHVERGERDRIISPRIAAGAEEARYAEDS